MTSPFDARPIVVAIAGPNGAGKSTFFSAHVAPAGLRFVNADDIARELGVDAYEAARLAAELRTTLIELRESFAFETVFSDPDGEKVAFLESAAAAGYTVVLCFIGIDGSATSRDRVAMRVMQGGHDVPVDKLVTRYPRVLANLHRAIRVVPHVLIFDNSDLRRPFRKVAEIVRGRVAWVSESLPSWLTLGGRLRGPRAAPRRRRKRPVRTPIRPRGFPEKGSRVRVS